MLADIFVAKAAGETHTRLSRAQVFVLGFLRALLEPLIVTKDVLLALVAAYRARARGPAMRTFDPKTGDVRAA